MGGWTGRRGGGRLLVVEGLRLGKDQSFCPTFCGVKTLGEVGWLAKGYRAAAASREDEEEEDR